MKTKKILALLLAATMSFGCLAGCGQEDTGPSETGDNTPTVTQPAESTPLEVTSITLYPSSANLESGVRGGYMKELFAEHGLEVEVWAYSEDKTNAIMASGELPDVMYVNTQNLEILIENNAIVNLGEYLDEMPHVTSLDGMDVALNYMKEFKSGGTGELYAMPMQVGKGASDGSTERYALKLFWDYYEEVGAPEFDSLEELIPILKEIQEKHPTDAAGNKVYAVGTYYNAKDFNYLLGYASCFGYAKDYFTQMVAANMADGELEYLLEQDGILYEALVWFNKLYREGLFDPDSINMDRATHQSKISANGVNGTYMISLAESPGWAPYYQPIYFAGEEIYFPNTNTYGSSSHYIVVNAETQNLDACLRLLDLMADPDAYLVWRSAPQGEMWDSEDGKVAYLTDGYRKARETGETFVLSTGEEQKLFNTAPICNTGVDTSYVDKDGNVLPPLVGNWPETLAITNDSEQFRAWQQKYGVDSFVKLLESKDALYTTSRLMNANSFVEQPDDNQKLTIDTLIDTINTAAWKMIYAESDSDFEALWNQMVSDAEVLGAKDIYNWAVENIENAVKIKDSLSSK